MAYYYEQILNGMTKIPAPGYPGVLIIAGNNAQSVFTGNSPGDTFIAAAEYGNGRVFVSGHDCYFKWVDEKKNDLIKEFMDNLKKWLTKLTYVLPDKEILDMSNLNSSTNLSDYKLIKWHHNAQVNDTLQDQLLKYLENGGAILCASTPWGYIQSHKSLDEMTMYSFLKNFLGIVFTKSYINLATVLEVEKNQAKFSNFNEAMSKVANDPSQLQNYCCTIERGIDVLVKIGLLNEKTIDTLKNMLIRQCEKKSLNPYPKRHAAVRLDDHRNVSKLLCKFVNASPGEKAPFISDFPGDFDVCPVLLDGVEIILETKFEERLSTGYYLPAGVNLLVRIAEGDLNGWKIRIGAHSDDLSNCSEFRRWPVISTTRRLEEQFTISSAFGGLVYFESPKEGFLRLYLTNVVETPYIDLNKPDTIANWPSTIENAPGLWAELAGKYVIITCPTSAVKDLKDPVTIINFWDKVVQTHHQCRGSNPESYRRERIVCDKQASAGYMHSGYPIVTHLDVCYSDSGECIFDINKLTEKGNWGLFHEIGHNLQRSEWTFDGCAEVTVNIFSMHAMQFIIGKSVLDIPWIIDQQPGVVRYFEKKPTYDNWKEECCVALMTFTQLIKYFGWQPMYKFLADYEKDIQDKTNLPKDNQDKINEWVIRYSKIIGRNIKPQFELWGLEVSDKVNSTLAGLQEWCPTEDIYPDTNNFFKKIQD